MKEFFFNFLEPLSPAFPLAILIYHFKKASATIELLLLFFLYLGLILLQLGASIFAYFDRANIMFYNLIGIWSFLILSCYFFSILRSKSVKKAILFFLSPIAVILFSIYIFYYKKDILFDSISFAILSIIIILYCFYFIWEKFNLMEFENINDDYRFWIISSLLVYYMGSFVIFLTLQFLTKSNIRNLTKEEMKIIGTLWGFHNVIYFLSCLLSAYGLKWKKFRTKYL